MDVASLDLTFDGGFVRPLRVGDVHPGYVAGLNDPMVYRHLSTVRGGQTLDSVTEYVRASLAAEAAVLFGIWEAGATNHCGTVRLYQIEEADRTAYIGVCLFDRRVWGRGLGGEALKAVTTWGFEALGLRWIEAAMHVDNHASERAFRAAGYEWMHDVADKYLLNGKPITVKFFVARNPRFFGQRDR